MVHATSVQEFKNEVRDLCLCSSPKVDGHFDKDERARLFFSNRLSKKKLGASRPSEHAPVRGREMSKRLGGMIGCKDKISSWHLIGPPYGSNLGSTT